jgi:hypothetical protein
VKYNGSQPQQQYRVAVVKLDLPIIWLPRAVKTPRHSTAAASGQKANNDVLVVLCLVYGACCACTAQSGLAIE